MADVSMNAGRESLGVGRIIGDTFSLFFGRFVSVIILGIIPGFALVVLQFLIAPSVDFNEAAVLTGEVEVSVWRQVAGVILNFVGSAVVTALIIRMAYDAKTGKPMDIGSYFATAIHSIVPIVICSLIVGIATGIAALALIIPGLYVYAMWSVVTPAIVIENAGFGGLGRSSELTRGYRWSCLGTIIVMWICGMVPMALIGALLGGIGGLLSVSAETPEAVITIVLLFVQALATGLMMAFFGIGAAMIYARLREIKEGTSVEQLAEVFA